MAITINSISPICLDEFRTWANFDPLLFNQLEWEGCFDCFINVPDCSFWWQHPITEKVMSRELLAQRLCECSEEIKSYLGTNVAPTWITEQHDFPDFWMREKAKIITPHPFECYQFKTNCWNVNQWGQPLYTNHETVNTVPNDADGDGFSETHQIEFQLPQGVELEQLQFYFPDRTLKSGLPDRHFQICPIKRMDYDENTNTVCVIFDSWNLVRPELYITPTWTKLKTPLRICDDIYTPEIEVWSETIDPCKPEVEVFWYDGDCEDTPCDSISRFACVRQQNPCEGIFSFSLIGQDENGCPDANVHCVNAPGKPPDYIKIHYNAGLDNKSVNRALFYLTAGKYQEVNVGCECSCTRQIFGLYSQALNVSDGDNRFQFTNIRAKDLYQLFSTPTLGAWESWRILRNIKENRCC